MPSSLVSNLLIKIIKKAQHSRYATHRDLTIRKPQLLDNGQSMCEINYYYYYY
jgi:hypothetical protein